jgi:hypothetical protein
MIQVLIPKKKKPKEKERAPVAKKEKEAKTSDRHDKVPCPRYPLRGKEKYVTTQPPGQMMIQSSRS